MLLRLVLFLITLGVWYPNVHATDTQVGDAQLRQLAKRFLLARINSELRDLVSRKEDYQALHGHKSLAACTNWPASVYVWNTISEDDSLASARESALEACRARNFPNCTCRVIYEEDNNVLEMPDEHAEKFLKRISKNLRPFSGAPLPPLSPVTDSVAPLSRIAPATPLLPQDIQISFPLAPPKSIAIATIDCKFSYTCQCSGKFTFGFSIVAASSSHVESLIVASKQGYTSCFEMNTTVLGEKSPISRRYCRYITAVDRASEDLAPASLQYGLFKFLSDAGYKRIDRLWIEAAIQVDDKNVPIAPPISSVTPIMLVSNGENYEVATLQSEDEEVGCAIGPTYSNRIFSADDCSNKSACLNSGIARYVEHLERGLSEGPILAAKYTASRRPPGEFWFRRERLPSEVLGGSPIRENTTYVIKWWRPSTMHLEGMDFDQGAQDGDSTIWVDITSEVLIAVGNDKFREADSSELPKFEHAVRSVAWRALTRACMELKGVVRGDTCNLLDHRAIAEEK